MNPNNENENLFSEDYEPPKRENPYLKKNREKAKAEKEPKPKKRKDKPVSPPLTDTADLAMPTEPTDAPEEERRTARRSNFFYEHVKLITAIITAAVILCGVCVLEVRDLVMDIREEREQAGKELISITYVEGLTHMNEYVSWKHLSRFRFDKSETSHSVTWTLDVADTNYRVMISGSATNKAPTFVYLYDMKTGDHMNLNEDDFDSFIAAHPHT